MKLLFAPALALLVTVSTAQAVELKVLSGNGAKAAVRELCTQFERSTGHKIDLHFEVNADLKKKIEAGASFDVAVLNPPVIDALIRPGQDRRRQQQRYRARRSRRRGARRRAQARHRIGRGLQAHAAGGENGRFSGQGRQRTVFRQPARSHGNQAAAMQSRLKPMAAEDTVEVVARGDADMVVVVATRITDVAGVDVVGPIPEELQTKIGFAAGLSTSAKEPDAAKALIRFLTAPAAAATLRAKGVEPAR